MGAFFTALASLLAQPWFQKFLEGFFAKQALRADGTGPTLEEFQQALADYQRTA